MPTKILINIPMVTLVVDVATRHLSWQVYLSSIQASLTSDNYPTHYGCKCILLPIIFKWSQPRLIIMETSREAEYNGRFLTFAFGNRIALTVDSVNIEATDASALPTHSRSSWGPHNVHVMYKLIYTSSASACGICVKNTSYEYTLCVVSVVLATG